MVFVSLKASCLSILNCFVCFIRRKFVYIYIFTIHTQTHTHILTVTADLKSSKRHTVGEGSIYFSFKLVTVTKNQQIDLSHCLHKVSFKRKKKVILIANKHKFGMLTWTSTCAGLWQQFVVKVRSFLPPPYLMTIFLVIEHWDSHRTLRNKYQRI